MLFGGLSREISQSVFNRVKNAFQTNQQQVRTATKRAGGSRTHMQDSKGRRLGPKKHEGEAVKTGQIILRQRGTKWYPGFNVGIGRDHTLFALEPGFVRYYLDPFHPKRRFIGVALNEKDRLPYPHFDPTPRRLNRKILVNPFKAAAEEERMTRKEALNLPNILEAQQEREQKRKEKYDKFFELLSSKKFVELSNEEELNMGALRLVKIDGFFRGGKSLEDSRFYATYNQIYDLKLLLKKGELSQEEFDRKSELYNKVASQIDSSIMFDARFNPVKNITEEERISKRREIVANIKELFNKSLPKISKEVKQQINDLIHSPVFSLHDQVLLRRKYLKSVLPESLSNTVAEAPSKKTVGINRLNYETGKIETVYRTQEAFLSKL